MRATTTNVGKILLRKEGMTEIHVPDITVSSTYPPKGPAFYNPMGEFKRDVMVAMVSSFSRQSGERVRFADPLAGVGVGGIRVAVEAEGIEEVHLNDLNPKAMELAQLSITRNGVGTTCRTYMHEANVFLSGHSSAGERFNFIEIDPFGSPAPYLDSSLRALRIGGIIALTATDGQVLCGIHPEVSLRKYGGYSLKTDYCHEIGVRLLLGSLAFASGRFDLGIQPVFVHTEKHYLRVYSRILAHPVEMDGRIGYISQCTSCQSRVVGERSVPSCSVCGSKTGIAGPLWIGDLFDRAMIDGALESSRGSRLAKMFEVARGEVGLPATYYLTDSFSEYLGVSSSPIAGIIEALRKRGYGAARTIMNRRGLRTDADPSVLKEVFLKNEN